jgi:putative hydrolases of HD superfamily
MSEPTAHADAPDGDVERRLGTQLRFLLAVDQLKQVLRRTTLTDGSRRENAAEHSWHLAVFATVLAEHAAEQVNVGRVVQMLLIHDIVEIEAGDTFAYDPKGRADQAEREAEAADRLFALLPADQAEGFRALWEEFTARSTADARFAAAVDRLQPILLNHSSDGDTWREHGISAEQVRAFNEHIAEGAPALWEHAQRVIADAQERGWLR